MSHFKDNFSKQSSSYARFRPTYPRELFQYLCSIVKETELAWDCGTGNGQCAISLAPYFKKVIATDPSEQQIKNAIAHPGVIYKVEKAEACSLDDNSADLVCIAQALHWFEFDKFFPQVKRVLKQDGIIAAWAYSGPVTGTEIDKLVSHYDNEVIGHLWLPENRLIDRGYKTIPFPFEELATPSFEIKKELSPDELIGHISSWSATQRFIDQHKTDPTIGLKEDLLKVWGNKDEKKDVTWKMILRVGRHRI